ncbi:hypothetical protein GCM10010389_42160 [Streptomyces echinoruber]|uniref:Uncharacterized protein n=1 Tax=Streptomyces echinoruber TaxID=68898 RepID=A0A918RJ50_9ACTN|nr:hypothetical protein GCM10010389_42160 [Streptomyces echinoruber]
MLIGINPDTQTRPGRESAPAQRLRRACTEEDAPDFDPVPTRRPKRTGSQSDHGIATTLAYPVEPPCVPVEARTNLSAGR